MTAFLVNLLLAIFWMGATGNTSMGNLLFALVISYVILWWLRSLFEPTTYFAKLPATFGLILFFFWELICSSLLVAWDVITPRVYRRPGIIAMPLKAETDAEITLLAILITLTPGTLTIDVSDDRKVMYIHAMFIDTPEAVNAAIKRGFERRVLALLR